MFDVVVYVDLLSSEELVVFLYTRKLGGFVLVKKLGMGNHLLGFGVLVFRRCFLG